MRLHVEASEEELRVRADELVKALVEHLENFCPEIEEAIEKALGPGAARPMKFPLLEELRNEARTIFQDLTNEMIGEVVAVAVHEPPK